MVRPSPPRSPLLVRFSLFRSVLVCACLCASVLSPAAPLELVTSVPLVRARQVIFQDNLAWVAQNMDGAALVNFSDPTGPKLIRKFPPDFMQPIYLRVFPEQNLLVSTDRFRGLVTYDVSVPDDPTTVSVLPLAGMTTGFDVSETTDGRRIAVLSRAGEGLLAVDISNPAAPVVTDRFTSGVELSRGVMVRDGLVYLADSSEGGLKVLRLISPGRFVPLYQVNYAGRCDSVAAAGDYMVAGYGHFGVRMMEFPKNLDETTPTLKNVALAIRNRNRVKAATTDGRWLFTANEEMGVDMLDLRNPAFPVLVGEYAPRGVHGLSVQSVTIKDNFLYVPAWDAGVLVFRINGGIRPADFNLENLNENPES